MRDDIDNVNRYFMPPRLLKKRPSKAKLRRIRRRKRIRRLIALSVIVITVVVLAVSFTDAGCDLVLSLAKNYASEKMNLNLKAESISGNPLKGYTMKNAEVEDMNGIKIMSAESLYLYLNFSSLLKGKIRFSEMSTQNASFGVYESFYHALTKLPHGPLDRIIVRNSKIDSDLGVLNISGVNIDLRKFTADIDADINGLPLRGKVDIGDALEITSVNRADMNLGAGRLTVVGGLFNDDVFDIHATAEGLNLKEVTAMFPEALSSTDFDGTLNLNLDVTGTKGNPKIFGSIDCKGTKIYGFPFERMSANYTYSPAEKVFTMNNIQASSLGIPVQGEIYAMNISDENAMIRIKLDGSESNLEALHEVLNIPELRNLKGRIESFSVNVNGNIKSLNGIVNLSAPKITYMGRTISDMRLQMKLSGSDTGNVDGKFTFEEANGFIQGNIESVLRGSRMNLTAKIADLDIKRVENIIPDYPSYSLEGKITLSMSMKGSTSEPEITGSLSSNEFSVKSQKVMKPVIDFSIEEGTLKLDRTEGTVNGMPLEITGTLKPFPSSNPELDITASGIRITGALNNPSISFMASEDIKEESKDIESQDTEPVSTDIKEELSKDENTAD